MEQSTNSILWSRKLQLVLLTGALLLISSQLQLTLSQNPRDLCQSGPLSSFLCKAGQAVLGQASKFAQRLLQRPKHWGVPDNEPLELQDDYHGQQNEPPLVFQGDEVFANRHRQRNGNQPPARPNQNQWRPSRKRERVYCQTEQGLEGVCRPLAACYHRHGSGVKYVIDSQVCPRGQSLVCCPKRNQQLANEAQQFSHLQLNQHPLHQHQKRPQNIALDTLRSIIGQVFSLSGSSGTSDIDRANEIERSASSQGFELRKDSPSDLHHRFIRLRNPKLIAKLARDGADFLAVASKLAKSRLAEEEQQSQQQQQPQGCGKNKSISNEDGDGTLVVTDEGPACREPTDKEQDDKDQPIGRRRSQLLPEIDFSQTDLASRCPGDPICGRDAARNPFRTHDGSCNNLAHTAWGKSNTPYTRILPPDYEDGVNEVRTTGITGRKLPNARSVSLATVRWSEKADAIASVMLMQWGQFIDHDLTLAATTPMLTPQGTAIDCCNRRLLSDPRFKHPACISILLPDQDPFYARFQVGCMNLVRNAPSPPIGCRLRAREQLNQLTSFIDGSMIYGNDEQQAQNLRLFQGGLLKSSRINGLEFLPFDGRIGEGCVLPTAGLRRGMRCFVAGDNRVNELTGLVTTHALFLREHNRIARHLWSMNRNWPDERLYQEARRLVIAQIQHITYNEWLPLIVGPVVMRDFRLELSQRDQGFTFDYDPSTDPSIINEFAAAAYRLHSLVQGAFKFQTEDGQVIQQFQLRNIFNNPASLYREGNYDGCIHSMINEAAQSVDNHFTEELTNHLFQDFNSSFGMDLVAVNIQRGRDHGLPGYNYFRQACGLKKLQSFEQLNSVMLDGAGQLFSQLYAHVDDIDLFIAGSYERKLRDAMVGPVFACIIGEQFRRLKVGDRYWFENANQAGSFSPSQLSEIKRSSMARIICDNSEQIERTQPLAFLRPNQEWNPKQPCEQIPWVDLRHWNENELSQHDPFTFRRSESTRSGEPETNTSAELDDGLD